MRIIYKILLGMLIFNLLYLTFAGFFPVGNTEDFSASDATVIEGEDYANINNRITANAILTGVVVFATAVGGLSLGNWLSGGMMSLSVGSMITFSVVASIISAIWSGFSSIFQPMIAMGGTTVGTFYTIFNIVLGIIIALTLAEMFSGQSGVDQ